MTELIWCTIVCRTTMSARASGEHACCYHRFHSAPPWRPHETPDFPDFSFRARGRARSLLSGSEHHVEPTRLPELRELVRQSRVGPRARGGQGKGASGARDARQENAREHL